MDPEEILSAADCETERTPQELITWVQEKNRLFGRSWEGKEYVRSRAGLARNFIDEICPLSQLARHLFDERPDIVCKPSVGDENFDAVVIDYCDRPVKIHKLEFTRAIHSYADYVRRVYLPDEGSGILLSRFAGVGRKAVRDGEEPTSNIVWLNKSLELVTAAAREKRHRRYGDDTSLVIVFDDYAAFRSEEDLAVLHRFVSSEIIPLKLDFSKLFMLGWSGYTLLGYSLR